VSQQRDEHVDEHVGEHVDDPADLYGGAQWNVDTLRAEARDLFTTLVEVRTALNEMLEPSIAGSQVTPERVARIRAVVARRTHAGSPDIDEALRGYERDAVEVTRRCVSMTLASWSMANRAALELLPGAWRDGLYIEAILGILFGAGLVRPTAGEGPATMSIEFDRVVPEHLRPDVVGAVQRYARMNSRVVRRGE
jgi:hypothetical protein